MKFVIITHVDHVQIQGKHFGYSPYIREMNIWLKYVDEVIIVAPSSRKNITPIDLDYRHDKIDFKKVPDFSFINLKSNLVSVLKLPLIFWRIFRAMQKADHIHLRCPGNMGLLGCFIQIFFPHKQKTAKYAGNWDSKSKQPWTYNLQKRILNNTFLTRNMKVLVYGEWEHQSKNIMPFFTATYLESEKLLIEKKAFSYGIEFIYTGSLVEGKNPMYAIKLVQQLAEKGYNVVLSLYGEGIQRNILESYIKEYQLGKFIFLYGNQNHEIIKEAYQRSHFVILPSRSEGWPKAIAEGMFWGCVPISTPVSCVPFMVDHGNRGVLLEMNLKKDVIQVENILLNDVDFFAKSKSSSEWSQNYTTDIFEAEIQKLIKK